MIFLLFNLGQELECEGKDRKDMNLAGNQSQLIRDAVDAGNYFILLF